MAARKNTLAKKLSEAKFFIERIVAEKKKPPPEDVVVPLPPPTDTEAASLRALNKKLRDDLASTPVKTDSGWRKISVGVDSSAEFAEAVRRFREQLSAKFKASMAREMARPSAAESTNEVKTIVLNPTPQYTEPFKGPYIPTYPDEVPPGNPYTHVDFDQLFTDTYGDTE